jgi:hypothetical protein
MLDESGEALADGEPLPRRFISFFWGNGVMLDRFEPAATGQTWELSEQLAPFEDVKDYVNVCTGLLNRCENTITHHEGLTAFSGRTFDLRSDLPGFASDFAGATIDQLIADAIMSQTPTPIRSVQTQISKFMSPADNGTTSEVLSVRGEPGNLVPLPPQADPRAVWQTLFGEFVPKPDDRALRQSVLDYVRDDADRLRARLGTRDNQRLDAHFQGLYELEQKITALPPPCELPGMPTEDNAEANGQERLIEVNEVVAQLLATAFVCDITRVASTLFLGVAGEATLGQAGLSSTHHVLSHEGGEGYHQGIVFIMSRLADLMRVLRDTPDGLLGDNLLDSTIVYASSDCAIGWTHSIRRQPIILGGHGRGHLRYPGVHYQAVPATAPNEFGAPAQGNMSDVLLTCLQAFDPLAPSVGAGAPMSTTPLTAIMT